MKRLSFILLAVLVSVMVSAGSVHAQSGSCPMGTDDLGTMAGNYPDTTKICRGDINEFTESFMEIQSDGSNFYPCGQYVNYRRVLDQVITEPGAEREMFLVPPSGLDVGNQVRARFYLMQGFVITGPQPLKDWPIRFEYYNQNRLLIGLHTGSTLDYPIISTYFGTGLIKTYYNVYVIDQVIDLSESMEGGYLKFTHIPDVLNYPESKTAITSIQLGDDLPFMCEIPNYGYPPTVTPIPTSTGTITPTPTGTLTPTPTLYPTSIGVTVTPVPTRTPTPIVFATLPAEDTPTPWPPYVIPTVNWPTPYPTILAMSSDYEATVQAIDPTRESVTDSLLDAADDISNTWGTPRAQARAFTDPNNTGYITTTTSTGTAITEYITLPVGYMRGISDLMPNAWGFVLWLLALVGLVVFSVTSKFWLAVFKTVTYLIQLVVDFLYKIWTAIWELIPL